MSSYSQLSCMMRLPTTVKRLTVTHYPVNDSDTFTHGDVVMGQVTLEVVREYHIDSLFVKFEGKSKVSECLGDVDQCKEKYFSIKYHFIKDGIGDNDPQTAVSNHSGETYNSVVAPGCYVYPFTFTFPEGDFPSSFTGSDGKIIYRLEARLGQSLRTTKKDMDKLNFVGRVDLTDERGLQEPQQDYKNKKLKFFSSGTVSMDVCLDKTGYFQGEGIKVVAQIQNNSSRPIKPKYCLYRKHIFVVNGEMIVNTHNLLKEVGDPIPPFSEGKVTRVITVPLDVEPSIHNCTIIKSEHRLRVYLDVKYATDPEIKFPIVILPISAESSASSSPPVASDFGPGFSYQTFWNPNQPILKFSILMERMRRAFLRAINKHQ